MYRQNFLNRHLLCCIKQTMNFQVSNSVDVFLRLSYLHIVSLMSQARPMNHARKGERWRRVAEGGRGWQRVTQWTREVLESRSLKANIIMEHSRTRRANGSRIQSGQSAWLAVLSVHTRNSLDAKSLRPTVVSHCQRCCPLRILSHRIRAKKGNIPACLLSSWSRVSPENQGWP